MIDRILLGTLSQIILVLLGSSNHGLAKDYDCYPIIHKLQLYELHYEKHFIAILLQLKQAPKSRQNQGRKNRLLFGQDCLDQQTFSDNKFLARAEKYQTRANLQIKNPEPAKQNRGTIPLISSAYSVFCIAVEKYASTTSF